MFEKMTSTPPPLPTDAICKSVSVPIGPNAKYLFSIGDPYSVLAFLACPIIVGLESYYRNRLGESGVFYVGGIFSWIFLGLCLRAFVLRRKMLNQWRATQQGIAEQHVSFTRSGFAVSESGGCQIFMPWKLVKRLKTQKDKIAIVTSGISVFFVSVSFFSQEELAAIHNFYKEGTQYAP